ncbi:hypothetical protein MMC24_001921 [Lignoscripta atroalba]|nr:hypothetical protein [Lignoscripta atroalba]
MSTTSTTTLQQQPSPAPVCTSVIISCQNCGADLAPTQHHFTQDAQQRIEELEAQVKILTLRATAAVEKVADYEDELYKIKSITASHRSAHNLSHIRTSATDLSHVTASDDESRRPSSAVSPITTPRNSILLQDRLSSFLPSRRSASQPPSSAPAHKTLHPPPSSNGVSYPHTAGFASTATESDLLSALNHEQTLRLAAESAVNQTNDELEELTGQLFQQANEMVASERKARAKLEERVVVLKTRDEEKRKRLEVLEGRLGRIESVRSLLTGRDGGAGGGETV